MLGLVDIFLRDHEIGKNHLCTHPETLERINLQPWFVTDIVEATKMSPERVDTWRPATEEDFKAILKVQGPNNKQPVVGELPEHIAKIKKAMFDKAMADHNKKETKISAQA